MLKKRKHKIKRRNTEPHMVLPLTPAPSVPSSAPPGQGGYSVKTWRYKWELWAENSRKNPLFSFHNNYFCTTQNFVAQTRGLLNFSEGARFLSQIEIQGYLPCDKMSKVNRFESYINSWLVESSMFFDVLPCLVLYLWQKSGSLRQFQENTSLSNKVLCLIHNHSILWKNIHTCLQVTQGSLWWTSATHRHMQRLCRHTCRHVYTHLHTCGHTCTRVDTLVDV